MKLEENQGVRDNIRAAWRTNPQLGFKEISLANFIPDYAKLSKEAIDAHGYKDVSSDDIMTYLYSKPETSLLNAYTKGLEGWADRVVPPAVARTAYVGPSLTSRGPMAWADKTQAAAETQGILASALQQRRQPLPMAVDE